MMVGTGQRCLRSCILLRLVVVEVSEGGMLCVALGNRSCCFFPTTYLLCQWNTWGREGKLCCMTLSRGGKGAGMTVQCFMGRDCR